MRNAAIYALASACVLLGLTPEVSAQLIFGGRSGGNLYTINTDGTNQQTIITGLSDPR